MKPLYTGTVLLLLSVTATLWADGRRVPVGAVTPVFECQDESGRRYRFEHDRGRAVLLVFLAAEHERSLKAIGDLQRIFSTLAKEKTSLDLDVVLVMPDPNALGGLLSNLAKTKTCVTRDPDRRLWGRFGVIALPTVIVSSREDRILAVKAGYGYDFAAAVETAIRRAAGLTPAPSSKTKKGVSTLKNDSAAARAHRHLRTAEMLAGKGQLAVAILEVEKAQTLTPNSLAVVVALSELYCRTDRGDAALALLADHTGTRRVERARLSLLRGWASRQVGRSAQAETYLKEAIALDPNAARAYFEWGRLCRAQGRQEEALAAYERALELLLDKP